MARVEARRGELHWADLSPTVGSEQGGLRPVLVLQDDILNARSSTTIVLAITSQLQRLDYPLAIKLAEGEGGLPKRSWIKIAQRRTLTLARFRGKMGSLSAARVVSVEGALLDVLGIYPYR